MSFRHKSFLDDYSDDEVREVVKRYSLYRAAKVFGYEGRFRAKSLVKQLKARGLYDELRSEGIL